MNCIISNPTRRAAPIKVLATAHSKSKNKDYPQVFIVEQAKGRVVGLTLGHDAAAHDHPAYIQLLRNAVLWAAGKETEIVRASSPASMRNLVRCT